MAGVGTAIWKWGRTITRKRVVGWLECGPYKYGAMGSSNQGDEAAVLIINGERAVISCVRYGDNLKTHNPYLQWVMKYLYQYGVKTIHWYDTSERQGKSTARKIVFQVIAAEHPKAQQLLVEQALSGESPDKPWYRSFDSFRQRLPEPA